MKHLLFLTLLLGANASPLWVEKGAPMPHGVTRYELTALTGSMEPSLHGKEFIWVEKYAGQPLYLHDWIELIRACDGKQVLHEITSLNERAVYTSGISAKYSDGWSPKKNVLTIVRFVERHPVTPSSQVR